MPRPSLSNHGLWQRRSFLGGLLLLPIGGSMLMAGEQLPQSITFTGTKKFQAIVRQAQQENWRALPMGQRVARFGMALRGTPYVAYTLEIDDHVESPSVNFSGLDCWTFFETSLGLARMIETPKAAYQPGDLLREIEWTRYRHGVCHGNYLDRIHHLSEWFSDNESRHNVQTITRQLGPVLTIKGRETNEMTLLWKSYRYLRNNPELRPGMARMEQWVGSQPFHYIPKDRVAGIEPSLQSGDIIGIVTDKSGTFCSHVGLALRQDDGVLHFMHASATYKKVVVDQALSSYLAAFSHHIGIAVARPLAMR